MDLLHYKYSQLDKTKRMTFDEAVNACTKMHNGQLKLFYTELLFLTKCASKGDTVLYVGAAEGYHTGLMASLYPDLTFSLWDSRPFDIEMRSNIQLNNRYFTDDDAKALSKSGKNILFICDIRDLDIGNSKDDSVKMDKIVMEDMRLQENWCRIMNPKAAFLKFRITYDASNFDYLTGTLFLQPYIHVSAELRLLTTDYNTRITYNAKEIDEVMAYFSANQRCRFNDYGPWTVIMRTYNIKTTWNNAFALLIIKCFLEKQNKLSSIDDIIDTFKKITKYHSDHYGEKVIKLIYAEK